MQGTYSTKILLLEFQKVVEVSRQAGLGLRLLPEAQGHICTVMCSTRQAQCAGHVSLCGHTFQICSRKADFGEILCEGVTWKQFAVYCGRCSEHGQAKICEVEAILAPVSKSGNCSNYTRHRIHVGLTTKLTTLTDINYSKVTINIYTPCRQQVPHYNNQHYTQCSNTNRPYGAVRRCLAVSYRRFRTTSRIKQSFTA